MSIRFFATRLFFEERLKIEPGQACPSNHETISKSFSHSLCLSCKPHQQQSLNSKSPAHERISSRNLREAVSGLKLSQKLRTGKRRHLNSSSVKAPKHWTRGVGVSLLKLRLGWQCRDASADPKPVSSMISCCQCHGNELQELSKKFSESNVRVQRIRS